MLCSFVLYVISHHQLSIAALIPRKHSPNEFSKYRPLSLIHGLYKIVAKLLSSRLLSGFAGNNQ